MGHEAIKLKHDACGKDRMIIVAIATILHAYLFLCWRMIWYYRI